MICLQLAILPNADLKMRTHCSFFFVSFFVLLFKKHRSDRLLPPQKSQADILAGKAKSNVPDKKSQSQERKLALVVSYPCQCPLMAEMQAGSERAAGQLSVSRGETMLSNNSQWRLQTSNQIYDNSDWKNRTWILCNTEVMHFRQRRGNIKQNTYLRF